MELKSIVIPSVIGVGVETTTNIIGGSDVRIEHIGSDIIVHGILNSFGPEQIGLQGYKARTADALFHVLGKVVAHNGYNLIELTEEHIHDLCDHPHSGPVMWTAILLCVVSEQIYKGYNKNHV